MPERTLRAPSPDDVRRARERIRASAVRTPLMRLPADAVAEAAGEGAGANPGDADALPEIWLKLENLQPVGCFKVRGAASALGAIDPARLRDGVTTASAGNMAQAVAREARRLGVPCRVIVPEHAPRTKLAGVERLGGEIVRVPFDAWWRAMLDHGHPDVLGRFLHPVCDPDVIAGNGTVALEILEDLPDVDTVIVPYGGGGLSCGIAIALKDARPDARVLAAEVETAAPLHAALAAGRPVDVDHTPSWVDGIGGKCVLEEMWPLARRLLDGSVVVGPDDVAAAVCLLLERCRVLAEGAGAVSVAAALAGVARGESRGRGTVGGGTVGRRNPVPRKVVCVVSGGNLDRARLAEILAR